LSGGEDGVAAAVTEYASAFDVFLNKEAIQIDFLISPAGGQDKAQQVHLKLVEIATSRKDCVAVISPTIGDVDAMISYVSTLNSPSSYLIVDGNWFKVYNKYQDKYEFIPAASSTAGVMAAADAVSAPWFSPAGSRRGQYLGVTELKVNPSKTERDKLYKKGINPIVSIPGQGVMLFGDKTHQTRPSAFDRINVRRLFLVIERAISKAGENVMFEFNDEFTRAEFVNIVEPFLREIQGRRGITDFRVVCDDTNNTAEVVDRNEFIATCFIKPARSINYVTLNFVAVRSGVEFEEVVGTV
jgi:phage tail sheath protein FI